MTEQATIRRYQDMLTIAGSSVIAFGIWSIAKIVLFLSFVDEKALSALLGLANNDAIVMIIYVLVAVIVLVDVIVRVYVGFSARAEGYGKKKGPFYLFVTAIAAVANASSLFAIRLSTSFMTTPLETLVSVVIETTGIAALLLVIYSSIRLRRMSKTIG